VGGLMRRESRILIAALGVIAIPLFCRTAMADVITVIGNLTARRFLQRASQKVEGFMHRLKIADLSLTEEQQ
jgi:hypothetical protein